MKAIVRGRKRGVTLMEVLIVVAIMALVSGMATIFIIPEYKKARIRTAALGADAVRQAALLHREIDAREADASCPTVQDLLAAKKLEPRRSDDPWGTRYDVTCEDEIHGVSSGGDRKQGTDDDVRDDVRASDVERIAAM